MGPGKVYNYFGEGYHHPSKKSPQLPPPQVPLEVSRDEAASNLILQFLLLTKLSIQIIGK